MAQNCWAFKVLPCTKISSQIPALTWMSSLFLNDCFYNNSLDLSPFLPLSNPSLFQREWRKAVFQEPASKFHLCKPAGCFLDLPCPSEWDQLLGSKGVQHQRLDNQMLLILHLHQCQGAWVWELVYDIVNNRQFLPTLVRVPSHFAQW